MPFARPGLADLIPRVEGELSSRLGVGPLLKRSVLKVLARVFAGASHLLHGHLDWTARQVMVDTAEKEHLERWASIWGISRKAATFATGTVLLTGNDGAEIPSGTAIQRVDGTRYLTQATVLIAGGEAEVDVAAELSGTAGNEAAAVAVSLVSPISGVASVAEVGADGIVGGEDPEEDEALRGRVLARMRAAPAGGAVHDYEAWALSVPGVTRVWVRPGWTGVGSVGVLFVRDDDEDIIPTEDHVTEVEEAIEELRPVTADVVVLAPAALELDLTIDLSPDSAVVRAAVEASLRAFIKREAEPGGTLRRSRISEAISVAAGESHHTLTLPAADVVAGAGELVVLGDITWS